MKRKTVVLLSSAVLLGAALTAAVLIRSKPLGNIGMSVHDGKPETSSSEVSFKGNSGDRVRVSLSTDVKSGTVVFVLYNSKGGVVENLGTAKAYRGFVDLDIDDTYTLAAEYTDFTGSFKADVSKIRKKILT
ncbi:MAG: hypothetical protein HDT24_07260 [Ruminococcus sp.]|nr:hypothetical protein [Ruminococcus sp.]